MLWDALYRSLAVLSAASMIYALGAFDNSFPASAADDGAAISREPPPVQDLQGIPTILDDGDAAAVLEGIQNALTEVADGSTYVWHRRDGRLSGMAQPTASFKDTTGQPCRHLIVMLNTPQRSSKVEGIACRAADLRWQLAG
jgi:surface antigen